MMGCHFEGGDEMAVEVACEVCGTTYDSPADFQEVTVSLATFVRLPDGTEGRCRPVDERKLWVCVDCWDQWFYTKWTTVPLLRADDIVALKAAMAQVVQGEKPDAR